MDINGMTVLGLSLVVLALLVLVGKHLAKVSPERNIGIDNRKNNRTMENSILFAGTPGEVGKKNFPKNMAFNNVKSGNMALKHNILIEEEGKIYVLVDMGSNRMLIMEQHPYNPEEKDLEKFNEIISDTSDMEVHAEEVMPIEESDSLMVNQIISESEPTAEDLRATANGISDNDRQQMLFEEMTKDMAFGEEE